MTITKMNPSSVEEALHLFEVMKKYNVRCSMEMQLSGHIDTFVGIADQPVRAEYIESYDLQVKGDTVVVILGESEFSFELNLSIGKHITDCQISLCIAGTNYTAWFDSGEVPPEVIEEAKNFKEDKTETLVSFEVNVYEKRLIEYIRELEFEDLLDAHSAIVHEAKEALRKFRELLGKKNFANAKGFQDRSIILMQLSDILADANADYRAHIYPEDKDNGQ
ncbi:hypothetical protein D3C71_1340780 [compost metagenome]